MDVCSPDETFFETQLHRLSAARHHAPSEPRLSRCIVQQAAESAGRNRRVNLTEGTSIEQQLP